MICGSHRRTDNGTHDAHTYQRLCEHPYFEGTISYERKNYTEIVSFLVLSV
jgi:hypothetical protein